MSSFFIFVFGLCIGSFLNVVAYRAIRRESLGGRSHCPSCLVQITWYDNIPVLSYIFLRARCRFCQSAISYLYPLIEILTAIVFTGLFFKIIWLIQLGILNIYSGFGFFFVYSFFLSALMLAVRTDLEAMVISRLSTFCTLPIGLFAALVGFAEVSFLESLVGVFLGYGLLWCVGKVFLYFRGIEGIGEGDMELLAMIGAFLGPFGVWVAVTVGSLLGAILGLLVLAMRRDGSTLLVVKIPFGPFLVVGALCYFFFPGIFFIF